ncbi:MAG: hypothetical protein ACLSXB_01355 [Blautia hansenii]
MAVLENLEPKRVFYYFEELTKIPHGSGNTKEISDYLVEFAKKRGLRYIQDESNNVVIFKDASEGYEKAPVVMLQGHMDWYVRKNRKAAMILPKMRCGWELTAILSMPKILL